MPISKLSFVSHLFGYSSSVTERDEEEILTGRSVTDNSPGADNIVVPSIGAFLNSKQVVFLLVIKDVFRALVPGYVLDKGSFDVPELESIVLEVVSRSEKK